MRFAKISDLIVADLDPTAMHYDTHSHVVLQSLQLDVIAPRVAKRGPKQAGQQRPGRDRKRLGSPSMRGPCNAINGALRRIVKKIILCRQRRQFFGRLVTYSFDRRQRTFRVLP